MIKGLLKDYADSIQTKAMLQIYKKEAKYLAAIAKVDREKIINEMKGG